MDDKQQQQLTSAASCAFRSSGIEKLYTVTLSYYNTQRRRDSMGGGVKTIV